VDSEIPGDGAVGLSVGEEDGAGLVGGDPRPLLAVEQLREIDADVEIVVPGSVLRLFGPVSREVGRTLGHR